MFSRVVAVRTKPEKARQFAKTIQDKVLPILEEQPVLLHSEGNLGRTDKVVLYLDP